MTDTEMDTHTHEDKYFHFVLSSTHRRYFVLIYNILGYTADQNHHSAKSTINKRLRKPTVPRAL